MTDTSERLGPDATGTPGTRNETGTGTGPDVAPEVRFGKTPLHSVTALPDDVLPPPPEDVEHSEVNRLVHQRPVPPLDRHPDPTPMCPPIRFRPVYDPFSARRRPAPEWLVNYVLTLVIGDTLVAAGAAWLAGAASGPGPAPDLTVMVTFAVGWPLLLLLVGAYAERRFGTGVDEFRRVGVAGVLAMAVCGLGGILVGAPGADRLLLVGAPVATLLTAGVHALNRWRLHRARREHLMSKQAVLVGREVAVLDLARRIRRDPTVGLEVVGACVPRPDESLLERHGITVLGPLSDVVRVIDDVRADAVVVASASETASSFLRDLTWRLEGTNIEVLVSPGLIEVTPSRLHVRPTTSLPLIHVREPAFRGHRRVVKAVLDRVGAAVLLVVGSPFLLAVTVAIRVTSPGPALYKHRRVGKQGRHFDLLKFRSMVVDADREFDALMIFNEGNAVQFKMRSDPRVTAVGRFLRRYSLDELPQLVNVLRGEMSFVGPRPHVDREVEQYGDAMHRRLLVKPGITGLWQVSGRSDLSWDEAVELDVRYVENWSLGLDLLILWRTFRAVLRKTGAY